MITSLAALSQLNNLVCNSLYMYSICFIFLNGLENRFVLFENLIFILIKALKGMSEVMFRGIFFSYVEIDH